MPMFSIGYAFSMIHIFPIYIMQIFLLIFFPPLGVIFVNEH